MTDDIKKSYHKKTILQVVPALISGGVERGTIDIAKDLKKYGHNPIIISAGGPMVQMLTEANIPHIKMNVASKNPYVIWKNAKLIVDIVKKYEVDIIHARSRAPAWSCYIAAKATGKTFVTTFHGIYNTANIFKKYYNSIMVEGERIIAVSNFIKNHIILNYKVPAHKISVIHRGVDLEYFNPANIPAELIEKVVEKYHIPSNTPVVLLPSRITSWKGHLTLVKALHKIKHLNFYCLMVGDLSKHPNYTNQVRSLILELKLQSKIQIFGNEVNMRELYAASDIILSASIQPEAFGRTIIEGQAMEKLVIATNIGGTAETIIDNVTGYHVKPKNAQELADKISYCLQIMNTPEAAKITNTAKQHVIENFSLDLMFKKTLDVYNNIT